jgi:hypothetical protein
VGSRGINLALERVDPEWIESRRLSDWYRCCKARHGSACSSPPYLAWLPAPEPQYFIDAVDKCLVAAIPGVPYVALSYVCGQDDCLRTTLENVDALQKPGELASGRHGNLPKTVCDAVNLLSILGDQELLDRNFEERNARPTKKSSKYFKLGCTFEEYMYSRRRLIFQNESACFECRHETTAEELDNAREQPPWDCHYVEFMLETGFPSLTVYRKMINLLSDREFTQPNDILSAFAGTLAILRQPMPGGFLYDLPEMFLDVALSSGSPRPKQPGASPAQMQQRTRLRPPGRGPAGAAGSTTAAGPRGNDFCGSSRRLIAKSRTWTAPVTAWHTADGPAGERRGIDVRWALWRDKHRDESVPLLEEWSRTRHVAGSKPGVCDGSAAGGYGKYLYHNKSTPSRFFFPLPLSDPSPQNSPFPDTRYLFGRVYKTALHVRLDVDQGKSLCLSLVYAKGKWAGVLRLHNLSDKPANRAELDMVAISKGSLPNKDNFS